MHQFKIVGLRVEKYLGTTCVQHNGDFEYGKQERDRHVILVQGYNPNDKKEITLSYEEGECFSGWCTASFGHMEIADVSYFAGKTHRPTKDLTLDLTKLIDTEDFECETFSFSNLGDDEWYPSGGYNVNMGLFQPMRSQDKRPVYIFTGDSNLCKSHIAALTGKVVFETDAYEDLPDSIDAEIIVKGNKWKHHTLEDMKGKILNKEHCKIIIVNFSE